MEVSAGISAVVQVLLGRQGSVHNEEENDVEDNSERPPADEAGAKTMLGERIKVEATAPAVVCFADQLMRPAVPIGIIGQSKAMDATLSAMKLPPSRLPRKDAAVETFPPQANPKSSRN